MEIKQIRQLPYISKATLASALGKKNRNTLTSFIYYWQKKGELIKAKRGIYVFKDFIDKTDNALYYPRFLATKLIEPSYLSSECILQQYQILTDVVFNYSIITTKKTNTIRNKLGLFNYQSIKPELFSGFIKKKYNNLEWYEATKAKALFDFLYFKSKKIKQFSKTEINEMRLNLEFITNDDWKEFESYLKFGSKKMILMYKLIK